MGDEDEATVGRGCWKLRRTAAGSQDGERWSMWWRAVRLQQAIGYVEGDLHGIRNIVFDAVPLPRCASVRVGTEGTQDRLPAKVWVAVLADPLPWCSHGIGGCALRGERVDGRVGIVVWVRLREN